MDEQQDGVVLNQDGDLPAEASRLPKKPGPLVDLENEFSDEMGDDGELHESDASGVH